METSSVTKRRGYIYAITADRLNYKIGLSNNPVRRLKQFQTSNPALKIEAYIAVEDMYVAEKHIHTILAPYHTVKEWFCLTNKKEYDILFGNVEVNEQDLNRLIALGLRAAK